jgi:hypothetical protein
MPPNDSGPVTETRMKTPLIFISYSHKDEDWLELLVAQLGVLQQNDRLKFWTDREIGVGKYWFQEIEEALQSAVAAILLVSADSLNSNFILKKEVARLLELRDKEGLQIIPVIIKECPWEAVEWLARMQVRPRKVRPLPNKGSRAQKEFKEIALELAEKFKAISASTMPVGSQGSGEYHPRKQDLAPKSTEADPRKFDADKLRQQLDEAASKDPEFAKTLFELGGKHMVQGQSTYRWEDPTTQSVGGPQKTTGGT